MLLEIKDLGAGYQKKQVIYNVSLAVDKGEIVSFIGHNGGGKTTTLKAAFGLLKPMSGKIIYRGEDITGKSPTANVKGGLAYVPQEKALFTRLSVLDNLKMGAYTLGSSIDFESKLTSVYQLFPVLKERAGQRAGTLSGGERKMLSLGMALMVQPQALLLDEPSLGLAPVLAQQLGDIFQMIREQGTAILLVEQNVKLALRLAHRVYVMKAGHIILEDSGENLRQRRELWDLF